MLSVYYWLHYLISHLIYFISHLIYYIIIDLIRVCNEYFAGRVYIMLFPYHHITLFLIVVTFNRIFYFNLLSYLLHFVTHLSDIKPKMHRLLSYSQTSIYRASIYRETRYTGHSNDLPTVYTVYCMVNEPRYTVHLNLPFHFAFPRRPRHIVLSRFDCIFFIIQHTIICVPSNS